MSQYPGAVWRPGAAAGYAHGHTTMQSVVCHYTVGKDSRPVGDRGYFNFLVSRDGTVTQFAEADALTWHAGNPFNGLGPGIEVEYLDEPDIFTPEAHDATAHLCQWLSDTYGIPLDYYDQPAQRIPAFHGFISHRSVVEDADLHNDYWPDLPRVAAAPTPTQEDRMQPELFLEKASGKVYVYDGNNATATWLMDPDALAAVQAHMAIHGVDNSIKDNDLTHRLLKAALKLR